MRLPGRIASMGRGEHKPMLAAGKERRAGAMAAALVQTTACAVAFQPDQGGDERVSPISVEPETGLA
jgi:hypothetical protein